MQSDAHRELIKKIRRIQIRTSRQVEDLFSGGYHSSFKGRGMEFDEVRAYIPGDDIRTIDWNVTARTGSPHIKKFIEEREMTVMLLVDMSASHLFGSRGQLKRDLVAEVTALLAFSAIENNDRIGLILFTDQVEKVIPPKTGTRHVLRMIRELLTFTPKGDATKLSPALDYLNHICPRRTTAFILSDLYYDDHPERLLTCSAKRHDLISVCIRDPQEMDLPSAGIVPWQDAESGECILIDTASAAVRNALRKQEQTEERRLKRLHERSGIDLIRLYTDQPYEKAFRTFFAQRAHRR
jgi:uncharacterized protein (DUF58 family)